MNTNGTACKLRIDIRKLMSDYDFYINQYILYSTITTEKNNLQIISERLEQNVSDIGNIIGSIYGEYNGNRFAELFNGYLYCELEFLDSTINNDVEKSVSDKLKWYMNCISIVDFLSAIDNFYRSDLRELFFENIHLTEIYVISRIHKNCSDNIESFDNLHSQTMNMADFLSNRMIQRL